MAQLKTFFVEQNSPELLKLAAIEVATVFHSCSHHLSYRSLDWGAKLYPCFFNDSKLAKKVSLGRTKAEAILKNIIASYLIDSIKKIAKGIPFSVATDPSNKGHHK